MENPIPFAPPLARVLSTGYLHARYAVLLLCPVHLSADWSFACIPLVESVLDWRNAATLLLYAALAAALLQGRPWSILVDAWQQPMAPAAAASADQQQAGSLWAQPAGTKAGGPKDCAALKHQRGQSGRHRPVPEAGRPLQRGLAEHQGQSVGPSAGPHSGQRQRAQAHSQARWRMVVVLGLVAGPFLPASNILFYVGTFIGERLLYMPSVGFCLLVAHAVMLLLGPGGRAALAQAAQCAGLAGVSVGRPHASNSGSTSSEQQAGQAVGSHGPGQASGTPTAGRLWGTRAAAAGGAFLALLLACASKTVLRNSDWKDEELLFIAAQKVRQRPLHMLLA